MTPGPSSSAGSMSWFRPHQRARAGVDDVRNQNGYRRGVSCDDDPLPVAGHPTGAGLMPRRTDIESICLIGSGPIVIGQACEFDYAGCQALKVLREDGFRTIVVNSNPATIMTDPGFADRTYIEPLDVDGVADVLARERPDALLPTMGGQTALNLALELHEAGVLEELGVELIGAKVEAIARAEARELFKAAVESCGLRVPNSRIVTSLDQLDGIPVPAVIRPAFTLGGHGGGFVTS